jgi:hypothetical protein
MSIILLFFIFLESKSAIVCLPTPGLPVIPIRIMFYIKKENIT